MAGLSPRARLYQRINDSLSEEEVRSLRAMLVSDEHLGKARVESATPQEMFNMLEDDNKIGKGNLALLVDLLKVLGRAKLAQEAEDVAEADEAGALEAPVSAGIGAVHGEAKSAQKAENTTKGDELGGGPGDVSDVIICPRDLYATEYAHVQPLPWCEDLNLDLGEVYTNLQLQRRDERGRFKGTSTVVSLADIFKRAEGEPKKADCRSYVRKIRVEGPPGVGKSCSCQKLAHDWSSGKLGSFKAVFFLELRHLFGKVKDAIFEQLLPKDTDISPEQLWSYIKKNQNEVLFILDGLDELSQKARESTDVVDLIQGKILRNCHVIVTSRPYHCVKDLHNCHEFNRILGYSEENSLQCIHKYFSEAPESATKLVEQLTSDRNIAEIVVNPLNNVLICVVWEDGGEKLPKSKADLYKMMVYSVAKRYCGKEGIPLKGSTLPSNIHEALRGLGKLSWEGLQQDQLQFNIDDIRQEYVANADDMLSMGLLTRDRSFSRIERTWNGAFLHKTFQEYMAAYYISELIKNERKREKGIECLRCVFGMTEPSNEYSLVFESRHRYKEVQDMLPEVLGENSGQLFELFVEELTNTEVDEGDRALLSFICVMSLGRACKDGKLAEIVAPCFSPRMTNGTGYYGDTDPISGDDCFKMIDDNARWFDGFLQILSCQKKLAMGPNPRLLQHLTIDCYAIGYVLQQHQLVELESTLSDCVTLRSLDLWYSDDFNQISFSSGIVYEGHMFTTDEEQEIPLVTMLIPRCGIESVSIELSAKILEHLSELPRLEHVDVREGWPCNEIDFPKYDSMLAEMVRKQSCLKTLRVCGCVTKSKGTGKFDNLKATLLRISERSTLEVVALVVLLTDSDPSLGEPPQELPDEHASAEIMVQKLTECINRNRTLMDLQIRYEIYTKFYKPICSSQSVSKLCSAIERNKTLKSLTVEGVFSESDAHQELIDQLMMNKPEKFEELKITMFKEEDKMHSSYFLTCSAREILNWPLPPDLQ
ncbi:uncharacterized protein LOC118426046 [Branchiostoma floridae]|uniref:Uncharacterized protein LOC118426046 n=1 Tax=Branchiostoma floridae TaxID=7739 RepID=C3XV90_BRAFL|nr:uncharacterized protein LOC118426046 [Branchiostoma floridae]|eukprot:XP_002612007.1 hypothetical protein BRAFLDRAFT_86966 [Branchiostoma floridae]